MTLPLGTNGIGNSGATNVAKLIERNKHLKILYLGCNRIDETGIAALASALTNSVIKLYLN